MNEPTIHPVPAETERLQAEVKELRRRLDEADALLQAERQMFHATAEFLSDIVFTALPDGSWDFVNARIYETTGLLAGAALGDGWTKVLHPDDRDRVAQAVYDAVASGTPLETTFRLQNPQGTYRRFVAQAHPLCDQTGHIARWIGTAMDVDDLLTAQDALDKARQIRQTFLGTMVHDLRNGIAPIANSAAVLRNPNADASQRQRSVEIIDRQVRDLCAYLDKVQDATPDSPAQPKDPGVGRLLKQSKRRILVVADDADFAEDWSMLLRVAGHDVCAAAGIQQAQELAQSFQPEYVAVNLPLLAEDGVAWSQRLRTQPALANAFIVAIADNGAAMSTGCDAVLRKPVKLQEFLQLLAERAAAG